MISYWYMLIHLIIYVLAFAGIWFGSGLAIGSVEKLSRTLRMSQFSISFLILGMFTSIGELSVGVNSIIENDPEIFVGNLIGATIILFMLVIPLLAIVGKPIKIASELQGFNLPASLIVISLPVFLSMDGVVSRVDSFVVIGLFLILLVIIQSKKGILEKIKSFTPRASISVGKELLKIIFGLVVIFVASNFVVDQTVYFAELLEVSPFLISLLFIAIGTNVPELSLVFRSAALKSNQVAFGDYIGSSAFNSFLFGSLALGYGQPIFLSNSYLSSLLFLVVGLLCFYLFARSKNTISRAEGFVLLGLYVLFLLTEVTLHKNLIFWN